MVSAFSNTTSFCFCSAFCSTPLCSRPLTSPKPSRLVSVVSFDTDNDTTFFAMKAFFNTVLTPITISEGAGSKSAVTRFNASNSKCCDTAANEESWGIRE